MWELSPTDEYQKRARKFVKKYRRELQAALDNLDTYLRTLQGGVPPLQVKHGFLHPEPHGVVAIDQKGGGAGLKETRLYVYADRDTETVYLITLGDKSSQSNDITYCREFALSLREEKQDDHEDRRPDADGEGQEEAH